MALLAEVLVQEWLNRSGYFTIRGIQCGVHEIDLLAVRCLSSGEWDCRHVEVQASSRPVTYLAPLSSRIKAATNRASRNAKRRSEAEMRECMAEWVSKKWELPAKVEIRNNLAPGPWKYECVIHKLRHEQESELLAEHGVTVRRLTHVVTELGKPNLLKCVAGSDILDLMEMQFGGTTAQKLKPVQAELALNDEAANGDGRLTGLVTGLRITAFFQRLFDANHSDKLSDAELAQRVRAEFPNRDKLQTISMWRSYYNSGLHGLIAPAERLQRFG